MTIRTVTYDTAHWQLVPKRATQAMIDAAVGRHPSSAGVYLAMLAAAPDPQVCFCDEKGIGDPAASCGDCPRDYGIPTVRANPEPPAQQPTRDLLAEATEQVEALKRENHRMRRCVARLMARLTVWLDDDQFNEADGIMYPEFEPPAQQPMVDFDIAIAAGDGTLHGAIDHWQERALTAEAKLAAQHPVIQAVFRCGPSGEPGDDFIGEKEAPLWGLPEIEDDGTITVPIDYWPAPIQQPMTDDQIVSACYTYRHDFGLLPEIERHLLMAEARRWADAFGKEIER